MFSLQFIQYYNVMLYCYQYSLYIILLLLYSNTINADRFTNHANHLITILRQLSIYVKVWYSYHRYFGGTHYINENTSI